MEKIMKKVCVVAMLSFIIMLALILPGCGQSVVHEGTYVCENDKSQEIVVDVNTIKFVNVNFDKFNEELKNDLGGDLRLAETLSKENKYSIKDNCISVEMTDVISLGFEFSKKVIIVNGENFILN